LNFALLYAIWVRLTDCGSSGIRIDCHNNGKLFPQILMIAAADTIICCPIVGRLIVEGDL
jgi:hypothetical protein